ncbi:OmpA family protein [Helicobacter himalayensis]|uniref:OmpA family protein n=1 Tax=Helicobacter himalayensis TaxID=1591088 RepID=UPI00082A3CC5|nr:OmpA family protein [Helicobacter himalayensis]
MKKVLTLGLFGSLVGGMLFLSGCGGDATVTTGGDGAVAVQGTDAQNVQVVDASDNTTQTGTDNFVQPDSSSLKNILFKFDKYDIQASMVERVDEAANALKSTGVKVVLEGNTDSFGSDEYNFALGKKRADSVKNALTTRGVDSQNISTVTYGESKPVCTQPTKECYQANRRVEFKVVQ